MANERLGLFEELQAKRQIVERHMQRVQRRCISMGPAANGAYAQPYNPFDIGLRLRRIGPGFHHPGRNDSYRRGRPRAMVEQIDICRVLQAMALAARLPIADMVAFGNQPWRVIPRHAAMWCIDRYCSDYSLTQIGVLFARDHTTVKAAIANVDNRIQRHHTQTMDLIIQVREQLGVS